MDEREYPFDVCLSYASEDQKYVDEFYARLKKLGLKVFYDKVEKANLVGENLCVHFDAIFRTQALYCVIFISKYYPEKPWTMRLEFPSAQQRALFEDYRYIIPVKLDDTDLPGLPTKITGCLLPAKEGLEACCDTIKQKVDTLKAARLQKLQKKDIRIRALQDSLGTEGKARSNQPIEQGVIGFWKNRRMTWIFFILVLVVTAAGLAKWVTTRPEVDKAKDLEKTASKEGPAKPEIKEAPKEPGKQPEKVVDEKKTGAKTVVAGVEYELKCTRVGENVVFTFLACSLEGTHDTAFHSLVANDNEGGKHVLPWLGSGPASDPNIVKLHEGVMQKIVKTMPIPLRVTEFTLVQIGGGAGAIPAQFRNIKIAKQ
jgi:hypothetical protein